MNKNDFYKELMTQYALDPEKIRMNAIKQAKKPVWQKVAGDYWKPAFGAAAAIAVTVAGVSYANQSSAPDITVDPVEALSASQRLREAEQDYYNVQDEALRSNVYITFMEQVSYNEILMALSTVDDSGEIELCTLYFESGKLEADELAAFAANSPSEESAVAAKISLPAHYYRDIQDLSIVYLAELGSDEINDDTFTPIAVEDDDPLENDYLSITTAVTEKPVATTTTPFSFSVTETSPKEAPVIGDSGDNNTVTTLPPVTEKTTTETEEELIEEDEPETTTAPVTSAAPEETTTTYYRGGVGLLTEIYELNVKNSLETYISGDNVVVLAKNEAYFYTLGGFGGSQNGTVISVNNPKFAYKGDNFIILSGCNEDGTRNVLSVINLASNTVYTYDASANIGDSEIGAILYSKETDRVFMKTVSAQSTLIYELTINGSVGFRPLAEIEAPVSLAGFKNDILYFTITENAGETTRLYSFNCTDGATVEIACFGGTVKIKRSSDCESFAVLSSENETSFILDANLGRLIPVQLDEDIAIITFGGETYFRTNGAVYRIDSTTAVLEANEYIEFEKSSDELYIINEINADKVVVISNDGSIWN